jgi:hypothetical protein
MSGTMVAATIHGDGERDQHDRRVMQALLAERQLAEALVEQAIS